MIGVTGEGETIELIVGLEACVEGWLRPFIQRLKSGEVQPRPKVINDALWGSIRLDSWEVAILDTPLLQRLRFLRQLGVVHWVYPSAGHTRLEHSLGVVHQMEALLAAIERTGNAGSQIVDDATRRLLRIAALVHDCGHTVMCHVSEEFINALPGVEGLRKRMHREFRPRRRPSASEAFAAVFVQSPAFRELLGLPVVGASFIRDVNAATRQIAGLILGGPVIEGAAFLTLLVNGAFDADKLDYMPRDSMMGGVPCPVDVRRVIETVRVVEVPAHKLPSSYPKWAGLTTSSTVRVLTLTGTGARVLDELAMARSLLYEKMYFHHKVRALEVTVRRALRELAPRDVPGWLQLVDDELLVLPSNATFASIRARDLLKRAVVLTAPNGAPNPDVTTDDEANWSRLMAPGQHALLRNELRTEAERVAGILGTGVDALKRQPPEIDAPPIGKIGLDQHAFVGDSVEEFTQASAALSGQRTEAGRRASRQTVYIFAPEGAVLPAFVAARNLLRTNYGIVLGADAYRATRLDPEAIATAERVLKNAGYFGDHDPPAIPTARVVSHRQHALETLLRTSWSRLERLSVDFGQYQPHDDRPISPARIADYLRQFETERLARTALLVLEAIQFKDRHFFANALKGRLAHAPHAGVVCPLGATGDSSAFLSYLMNDLPRDVQRPVLPLELALDRDGRIGVDAEILLWDDFCGRAGHAATALSQWIGLEKLPEDEDLLLEENLVWRLNKEREAALKRRNVKIAFALARAGGIDELRAYVKRHGLDRVEVLDAEEDLEGSHRLFDTSDILRSTEDRNDLRCFLERRMRHELAPNLARPHRSWTVRKLEERLLGYGGEGHLLVFSYNVPTVTLTALWAKGPSWSPLFPRREKPSA
ncbi:MAG: putative dNTP triphosphohydrolase, Archaeal subgroup [Labilithrix sp.]|nr:putative dNTP triphosphohydrolase, Archaeal subgroup [Labilithrix sp.]